nr:hypothetical protein [Tanacetum cinerariifolium]
SGNEESLGKDASKQGRINSIDADEEITRVSIQDEVVSNNAGKEMFDVDVLDGEEVFVAEHEVVVKRVNNEVNVVEEVVEVIDIAKLIIDAAQDKVALNLQAAFDEEERLVGEKAKKVEEANIALIETWDDIQAKIDADHQLAERMQAQEQEELSIAKKLHYFNNS